MKNKSLQHWGVLCIGFWAVQGIAFAENKAEELELGTVDVVATTPLPSLGTPLEEVPANVQTIKADQIKKQKPSNLGEFMGNNLGTVNISNSTGNPYQMDVSYRGFTASPILGTPSGMSVFLDGVRFNEPFGDYVNWDLIPMNAVSSVNLIPGSNPLFGLNALGGSIAVMTKSGATYKGGQATVTGGSWGRKAGQFEYGGEDKERGVDYYFSANSFSEDGWRPHNSSRINQIFSKVGWHDDRSDLDLSVALADNTMQGTQGSPLSMLRVNRAQSYTYPDIINNKMALIALKGSHFISDEKLVAANVYYRMSNATNFNSNAACDDTAGCPSYTINGSPDPAYAGTGAIVAQNVASKTYQDGFGGSMQFSYLGDMLGHANKLTVGASADLSRIKFSQDSLGANLVNYQTITDPAQGLQNAVKLKNHTDYYGLYATDNFTFNEKVHVTVSGRYNIARTTLSGANTDYTAAPATATSLNGNHQFERFNPAIGLTYNPSKTIGLYGGYNEGMRVPTPVELTCSNPNIPCSLPTGFNSDPSLKKIVAKTWEGGVRGKLTNDIGWNAGVYETRTYNEIEFIYSNNNQGIFQNVGQTLRRGIELGLNGKIDKLTLSANYGFVDATFQSGFQLSSPANSAADTNGVINVRKGNHLPGVARQTLKFRAAYDVNEDWYIGSNLILIAGQYPYGDQNNQDVNGKVPGYAVVNLDSAYKISPAWTASLIVTNLFDKSYATFGQLGNNIYTGGIPAQFRTPSAPRGAWLSVSYQFGGEAASKKRDVD